MTAQDGAWHGPLPPLPAKWQAEDLETARAALARIAVTVLEGPEDERTAIVATARGALLEMKGHAAAPELAAAGQASDLEVAAVITERNLLRDALQRMSDGGNIEARSYLASIWPELTRAAQPDSAIPDTTPAGEWPDPAERADVLRMRREMAREAGDDSPGADL